MAGKEIDEVPGQQPSFDKDANTKTVAFKFEPGGENGVEGLAQTEAGQGTSDAKQTTQAAPGV